ncbi:MAG TPA: hypothetical protein VHG09_06070, partial [Longimicrobiales bacterium]|nr:hypothetical protein [Longimicrobiales bacterium]
TREPPASVAVVEPGDTASDTTVAAAAPATVIEPDALTQAETARALLGQNVELTSVTVQDVLGSQMFWIGLPGGSPYLVKLDSALVAAGTALPQVGGNVRVVGRMMDKTPAVLDGWQESGVLDSDQRTLAEFGSTYIEAGRVEPAGS